MIGGDVKAHLVAALCSLDAQYERQVRLSNAGGSEQNGVLTALDESQTGELSELHFVGVGKAEIKILQPLNHRKSSVTHA